MGKPGRPPNPIDPAASAAAKLGAELRRLRTDRGLTQAELGVKVGYSAQHVSGTELAKTPVSGLFIAACDKALDAEGALMALMDAVVLEQAALRYERSAARDGLLSALPYGAATDAGEDVDPTNRRGALEAGAAVAIGTVSVPAAPVAARDIDPELPEHWRDMLTMFGRYDAMCGPHEVFRAVRRELRVIAEHRAAARGDLRTELMRVEARWTVYAAWLANDTGDVGGREALLDRALYLARESDCPDVLAWARARQAQCSEPPRALRLAEAGLRTPRAGAHTRALCTVRAAYAHACIGDAESTARSIAEAEALLTQDSPPPPDAAIASADRLVRCWEARCWSALKPARGVALYEDVLRDWPRRQIKDDGLYRARMARACADAGELDRARAEGHRALAITKQTRSSVAARELRQLGATLNLTSS